MSVTGHRAFLPLSAPPAVGFLVGILLLDIVQNYLKYRRLARESKRTAEMCATFRESPNPSLYSVMQVAQEYDIALTNGLPIPTRYYERHRDDINDAYRQSHVSAKKLLEAEDG